MVAFFKAYPHTQHSQTQYNCQKLRQDFFPSARFTHIPIPVLCPIHRQTFLFHNAIEIDPVITVLCLEGIFPNQLKPRIFAMINVRR